MPDFRVRRAYQRWFQILVVGAVAFLAFYLVAGGARLAGTAASREEVAAALWNGLLTYGWWVIVLHAAVVGVLIVMDSRQAEKTMLWLFVLAFVPVLGLAAYWVLGPDLRQGRRRRMFRQRRDQGRQAPAAAHDGLARAARRASPARLLAGMDVPMTGRAARVDLFFEGRELFDRLAADLAAARREILMEYYIFRDDDLGRRIAELLAERARAGVRARLVVDAAGSGALGRKFFRTLRTAGVDARPFHPVALPFLRGVNYRNHRKIVVVDGETSYVGGFNIGDEYLGLDPKFGTWFDAHLRMEGSDPARALADIFWRDWTTCGGTEEAPTRGDAARIPAGTLSGNPPALVPAPPSAPPSGASPAAIPAIPAMSSSPEAPEAEEGGAPSGFGGIPAQVVASGPDAAWDAIHRCYFGMATAARRRLWITSPYIVPGTALMKALTNAALAGVDVRILMPGHPDNRWVYWCGLGHVEDLLASGARVFRYKTTGFMHAKTMVVDRVWASVGTANWDVRSMEINFEVQVFLASRVVAQGLEERFRGAMGESEELTLGGWRERGFGARLREGVGRLITPLA